MEKELTFYSAGLRLAGTLYLPDDLRAGDKRPTVLCCHGLRANRKVVLPEFARAVARQGYVAFVFDYRGFGDSEGPKWRLISKERDDDIIIPTPAEEKFYSGSGQIASLKSELPIETAEDIMHYKPEAVVHKISPRPVLLIGAELDYLVGVEECISLYEKAHEPKQLYILPGLSHYETYAQGFDTVMRLSLELFEQVMAPH